MKIQELTKQIIRYGCELDLGTCRTLKMIDEEAYRLERQIDRLTRYSFCDNYLPLDSGNCAIEVERNIACFDCDIFKDKRKVCENSRHKELLTKNEEVICKKQN